VVHRQRPYRDLQNQRAMLFGSMALWPGGDAGNRTRVRSIRPWTSTSVVRTLDVARRAAPDGVHLSGQRLPGGARAFAPPQPRRIGRTLLFMTAEPSASRVHAGAPWSPAGDQGFFLATAYAASAIAGAAAKRGAKLKALPVFLALVGFALDLRGKSASACSPQTACPVETCHPHGSASRR